MTHQLFVVGELISFLMPIDMLIENSYLT